MKKSCYISSVKELMNLHNLNIVTKTALFSVLLLMFVTVECDASIRSSMGKRKKKSFPLKSIKSPDGDIIDCIDIYQQPAFDHPLLKNHTIQMRPSYYPEGISGGNTEVISQLWQRKGSCPKGTIPLRRTKKEDLFRPNYGKKQPRHFYSPNLDPIQSLGHEHAIVYVPESKYHGAKAALNVWQPQVQSDDEFSLAQIWILGGPFSEVNTIEAGWQVFPNLYGDNLTRLFTYWTSDAYKSSGCYNKLCPGFVQISNKVVIGGAISPVSVYHGQQNDITIVIWKDSIKNAWWLSVQNEAVGYWPTSLFTHLADSASSIQWGGEVFDTKSDGQHTTTPMGSGHFAEERDKGASFFRNLQIIDESNKAVDLQDDQIKTIIEQPSCYNLATFKNDVYGFSFYFGGPGRNLNCP